MRGKLGGAGGSWRELEGARQLDPKLLPNKLTELSFESRKFGEIEEQSVERFPRDRSKR